MRLMLSMQHEEETTHGTDLRKGSMGELGERVVSEKDPQKQDRKQICEVGGRGVERVST